MTVFFAILTLVNFCVSVYLVYLFFAKGRQAKKNLQPSSGSGPKITLTRFNPFDDIGGDQSFILCLLDNSDSGVIITSLHNRDLTRIYAKSIKNGQPQSSALSKEEKTALIKTINS